MTKYAQKPDRALPAIRAALDAAGVRYILAPAGLGCDLIVYHNESLYFLEVKNPGEKIRLTAKEKILQSLVIENYRIVTTPEDALEAVGISVA